MLQRSLPSAVRAGSRLTAAAALLTLTFFSAVADAQEPTTEASQAAGGSSRPVVPQQIQFGGTVMNRAGDVVEAVFRIYPSAEGGEPLWTETQKVAVAQDGSYTALLGAASAQGLPQSIFGNGQARWVGVAIERGEEQARIPLASAPYAMKAADAQTLGGLPARSFVTQAQLAATAQALAAQVAPQITPYVAPSGSGTANYIPVWTSAANLGNSSMYLAGGRIGIGTTTPAAALHVVATSSGLGLDVQAGGGAGGLKLGADVNASTLTPSVRKVGRIVMPDWAADSQTILLFSGDVTSANNSDVYYGGAPGGSLYAATGLHFLTAATGTTTGGTEQMTVTSAGSVGIGTRTPAARLEVNGTAKFDGLITFASGQTFPGGGGGTITGITTTSPLTGSGTAGSVALGLNTAALETTEESVYDSRYALLSGGATFKGYVEANSSSGPGNVASIGLGSNGSDGVYGVSDSAYGVLGRSATGTGVAGYVQNPTGAGSQGVLGFTGTGLSKSYGTVAEFGKGSVGVWADTSQASTGNYTGGALTATADDNTAIYGQNNSTSPTMFLSNDNGVVAVMDGTDGDGLDVVIETEGNGISSTLDTPVGGGNAGVFGQASSASAIGSTINFDAGVWGDAGPDVGFGSHIAYAGVLGSADDWSAGAFFNNSASWPTLDLYNEGTDGIEVKGKTPGLFGTLMASSKEGTCGIGGGSMSCTGPIKSLATSAGGARTVETYSMQSPENWMEDFGTGQMERGVALVRIDPSFAETVTADSSYHVFITPNGDSRGLYVIAKTPTTFEVRESGGGTSTLAFDYRIVGKRRGMETMRLADVTERFNLEIKHAELRHTLTPGIRRPARAIPPRPKSLRHPARRFVPPPAPSRMPSAGGQTAPVHAATGK